MSLARVTVKRIDRVTRRWIRNASDELAARNGCLFDERRADHYRQVCRTHLRLWEGDQAGLPFDPLDWQWEVAARLFGWVRPSAKFNRLVRRFRKASVWVPKKNGKSPFGASVGIYLMAFDGEPGQAVYSAAKDGVQARIVHQHACHMARASPTLSRQCKIHEQTNRIVHPSTLSHYSVLAGDNHAGQEGKNGSCIIDEVQVVDERLALVLADMGASRAEPIIFQISTSGQSFDGYGRKEWEYGLQVEAGKTLDETLLHVAWSAPQDASDKDCEKVSVWKTANPAWGQTIDPDEFRASMQRAKRSTTDWVNWKQRRLNIWQRSANPWMPTADWDAAANPDLDITDFADTGAGVGLDLSRVSDMTSAVIVTQQDDTIGCWPMFWLPRRRAEELAHLVPILDWHRQGAISLLDSDVVDFDLVLDDLAKICEQINATVICYDPLFAEDLTQRLVARTGMQRVEFRQTWDRYTLPVQGLERAVRSGLLVHPANPVLDWQIGHTLIKEYGGKRKPLKDNHAKHKTIDGVQALCMGLAATWIHNETAHNQVSTYRENDLLIL